MNFFKSKKITIVFLLVLIIVSVGVFIEYSVSRDRFLGAFSQNPFRKQSSVNVSLVDSNVKLNFDLTEEDKPRFASFINNWFGTTEEIKTLSFGADENVISALKNSLPVNLKLNVTDKTLDFKSRSFPSLQTALVKNDFEFATGAGKLEARFTDNTQYQFKIENPEGLINYATSSGVITASAKVEGLFKSLPKVATIEVNVNGKNISGQIALK